MKRIPWKTVRQWLLNAKAFFLGMLLALLEKPDEGK